jgi:hypothetical protein
MSAVSAATVCLLAAMLAGCGGTPAFGDSAPAASRPYVAQGASARERAEAIPRREGLARKHEEAGDLPAAALQWHALTLIAPADPAYREALERTRGAMRERAVQRLQQGRRALERGDLERATSALLETLYLAPGDEEASQLLRKAERRNMARIQANHAARMRNLGSDSMSGVPARPQ